MKTEQKREDDILTVVENATSSTTDVKNNLSRYGLTSAIVESLLAGISLFVAFIIQRNFLNLGSNQFIIGQGELLKMSAGIAFCYAFVFVLRRGYLSDPGKFRESAQRIARYTAETYVIFLAMLFLIKDINFASARLSIGLGFILSLIGLNVGLPVLKLFYTNRKRTVPRRTIILKKPSVPAMIPTIRERYTGVKPSIIPMADESFNYSARSSGVFIINSVEDLKRLELMTTNAISYARIGNLSLADIPEAVKTARRKGFRLELVTADDLGKKRESSILS